MDILYPNINLLNELKFANDEYFWKTNNTMFISSSDKTVLSAKCNRSIICIKFGYISADDDWNMKLIHAWWRMCVFVCVWKCFVWEVGVCLVLRFLLDFFLPRSVYKTEFLHIIFLWASATRSNFPAKIQCPY